LFYKTILHPFNKRFYSLSVFRILGSVAVIFWPPGRVITMAAPKRNYAFKQQNHAPSLTDFTFIRLKNLKLVERGSIFLIYNTYFASPCTLPGLWRQGTRGGSTTRPSRSPTTAQLQENLKLNYTSKFPHFYTSKFLWLLFTIQICTITPTSAAWQRFPHLL
jgi:hypothetical protein